MVYSIDTSAILDGHNRYYPPDVFPKLWENLQVLINNGKLRAVGLVLKELERKDDAAKDWAKKQSMLFQEVNEEVQKIVTTIMGKYPKIMKKGGQKNEADPFVIAFAKCNNFIVVTGEIKPGNENTPTIPFLCREFDVKYINILELIRLEKWLF